MRFAMRSRPGIASPSRIGPGIAVGVIALMGFYGFATSMQKSASVQTAATISAPARDDARPAVAIGPMPSLVYAVTEGSPIQVAATPPPRAPRIAAPVIAPEPVAVNLVKQPPTQVARETLDVAANTPLPVPPAPSATDQGADASVTQVAAEPAPVTP